MTSATKTSAKVAYSRYRERHTIRPLATLFGMLCEHDGLAIMPRVNGWRHDPAVVRATRLTAQRDDWPEERGFTAESDGATIQVSGRNPDRG